MTLAETSNFVITATAIITVLVVVMLHYEVLNALYRFLPSLGSQRPRMVVMIVVLIATHVVEICLFATVYWLALDHHALGSMVGVVTMNWFDCAYFSASTYTTVGYGDLVLTGPLRLLAGTESLVGFVMLTWSASFTITQMHREWED